MAYKLSVLPNKLETDYREGKYMLERFENISQAKKVFVILDWSLIWIYEVKEYYGPNL